MKRGIWAWPPGNDNPTKTWTDSVIAAAIAAKIDTIYWFGGGGYAMWPSDILPHTTIATEAFDPLDYAIKAAHAVGLRLVLWHCPGILPWSSSWRTKFLGNHPTWDTMPITGGSQHWSNFDNPELRAHCVSIVTEVVQRYTDLDGWAYDYIRYKLNNNANDERWFPTHFTGAAVTQIVREMSNAIRTINPKMKIAAAVFAGWGGDRQALQFWTDEWMADGVVDHYLPMAYMGYDARFTWQVGIDHCFATWNAALHPERIYPILAFKDYGTKAMKPLALFQAQLEYVRAHGYGKDSLAFFDAANLTSEFGNYLVSIAPLEYVVVVNLLPQDATKAEKQFVVDAVHDSKQTICQSADDAKWLVGRGERGSKVVAWNPERWPDDIVTWLSPVTVEIKRF